MRVVFDSFAQGDTRVVGIRITPRMPYAPPSPPPVVVSGSWVLVEAQTGAPVPIEVSPSAGVLHVDASCAPYSFISTDPIAWMYAGQYVMRFDLLWADGTQDNTLSALIPVSGLAV